MNAGPGWYVYMVKCRDGSLYTGITTDVDRRVAEHNGQAPGHRGARYTRARRPVRLAFVEPHGDRVSASRREAAIKRLPAAAKRALLCA